MDGEDGVTFWSHDKPPCSHKLPPKKAQSTLGMVYVAIRREECDMVWWVGLAMLVRDHDEFREGGRGGDRLFFHLTRASASVLCDDVIFNGSKDSKNT